MSVISTEPSIESHPRHARPSTGADWLIAAALALAFGVPAVFLIGNWSLYDDEIFTYLQVGKPTLQCLADNIDKPIYYMLAHWTTKTSLPLEFAIRLPAALAASLIAPTFYMLSCRLLPRRTRLYLAILLITNPWIFEFSQNARFYSLMFLLAGAAVLCLLNWLCDRRPAWIVAYLIFGLLAALTHTTAAMVFPAGAVAAAGYVLTDDRAGVSRFIHRHWKLGSLCGILIGGILVTGLMLRANHWLTATSAGTRTAAGVLMAAVVLSGIQIWALAFLPLMKRPREWTPKEVFMVAMIVASIIPFLALSQLGARIHIRYLFQALPMLFVLAAIHWESIAGGIKSFRLKLALCVVILAMYVPYGVSNLVDGNHLDYRQAVKFIDDLGYEDPIIVSSFKDVFKLYSRGPRNLHELDFLFVMNGGATGEKSYPGKKLQELMDEANRTQNPLLVVSVESRYILDGPARKWMGDRFATLATLESPRYDHRRNQLVIYEYRPREHSKG